MSGFLFIVFGFVIVLSVGYLVEKFYYPNTLLEYSIIAVLIGALAVLGTMYFDLPIIGMAYRIKPEVVSHSTAIYTGLFLIGAGVLGITWHLCTRLSKK